MPMFSESSNTTRLLRRLLDVWICEELKMAHINLRLTDAMFNSQLIYTSGSLRSCLVMSPDPKTKKGISGLEAAILEFDFRFGSDYHNSLGGFRTSET